MFRVHIADHECGLLFRNRRFVRCLPPGCHRLWRPLRDRVEKVNRLEPLFRHPAMECLLRDPFLQTQLELVCLEPTQRALVWKRGRLASVAGPGQHAFWAEPDGVIVEVHDIREARLVHPRLDEVARLTERSGMKHRRLELVHDDEVMNWLMRHGFDPELGARHLCHAIHRDVSAAIARVLLAGDGGSDSAVRLSVRGDELHAELVRCMHGVASADVIPARR